MRPDSRSVVAIVLGIITVRLVTTDSFLAYVKPAMRWPLLLAGGGMVVLGGVSLWLVARRRADSDHGDDHDHDHGRFHVGWLLLLPVLVLLVVEPVPLGAYAAGRSSARVLTAADSYGELPASVDGAVTLRVTDFVERAMYDTSGSLNETPVRLLGFVAKGERAGEFQLTRFVLSCCAADAFAVQVTARTTEPVPAVDTWVEIVGRAVLPVTSTPDGLAEVTVDVEELATVAAPTSPYE